MTNITAALAKVRRQQEIAGKATPGPWKWQDWTEDDGPNTFTLVSPPETRPTGISKNFPDLHNPLMCDEERQISEADRAFIADARNHAEGNLALLEALLDLYQAYSQKPDLLHPRVEDLMFAWDKEMLKFDEAVERALAAFTETVPSAK